MNCPRNSKLSRKKISAAKNWKKILSPWRPSSEDIENYEYGINLAPIKNPRILILGATPELRDLLAKTGGKIWLIDHSREMLEGMTKFLETPPLKEKWIVDDWCIGRSLKKDYFDIILGDLVLRFISPKKQEFFLMKIKELLNRDGLFITRAHFVSGKFKASLDIIRSTLLLSDPHIPGRGKYVGNLLVSRLLDRNYCAKSQEIRETCISDIRTFLEKNHNLTPNQKNILTGTIGRLSGEENDPIFIQREKNFEKKLKKFFIIKRKFVAGDYDDSQFFPVYVLKSR